MKRVGPPAVAGGPGGLAQLRRDLGDLRLGLGEAFGGLFCGLVPSELGTGRLEGNLVGDAALEFLPRQIVGEGLEGRLEVTFPPRHRLGPAVEPCVVSRREAGLRDGPAPAEIGRAHV